VGRDPLTPVRVLLAQGGDGGKEWRSYAELWPAAANADQAVAQAELIWQERHAAIPQLPRETDTEVRGRWRPGLDLVELYTTLDGKRLVDDSVHTVPAPSGKPPVATTADKGLPGTLLALKGAELNNPVLLASVNPDVARVVVGWTDGTTSEPVPVPVGDSPTRWFSVARKAPGITSTTIKLYGADGGLLATDTDWLK
jgi:hypothetical protein